MGLPVAIPCGYGTIRIFQRSKRGGYEPHVQYRAAITTKDGRFWGAWSTSILSTVESLLPKLKLKQVQRDESWAEALKITENMKFQPAMSHKSRINSSLPTAVVYFKKNPYDGTVQLMVRTAHT